MQHLTSRRLNTYNIEALSIEAHLVKLIYLSERTNPLYLRPGRRVAQYTSKPPTIQDFLPMGLLSQLLARMCFGTPRWWCGSPWAFAVVVTHLEAKKMLVGSI